MTTRVRPHPRHRTYRGTAPASEPETKALDGLMKKRVGFESSINYHSAAELLLYGVGWQVPRRPRTTCSTRRWPGRRPTRPSPDTTPRSPPSCTRPTARPPTTRERHGTSAFTPEMSTCETAANLDPNDAWNAADCASVFTFPDDEKLIDAGVREERPVRAPVAETAAHPDQPSSSVGIAAPDFTPATFSTSYSRGADQEISVVVRRSVRDKELKYRGQRRPDARAWRSGPWQGGETSGGTDNLYFDRVPRQGQGRRPGRQGRGLVHRRDQERKAPGSSPHFTYTVAQRPRADVLVVAEEGATAHTGADVRRRAGRAKRRGEALVWDVATQGAPDALAVLDHFGTVVHYTGALRPGNATQLQLRAFLNEGGKLVKAGELAGGSVDLGGGTLSNDFRQYYLGAYSRTSTPGASGFTGSGELGGATGTLGDAPGNPLNAAGTYGVTSVSLTARSTPSSPPARERASSPGPSTPTGRTRARTWPPRSTPTTPTSASPAPSTSPGSPPPTSRRSVPSSCGTPSPATTTRSSRSTRPGADDWTTLPRGGRCHLGHRPHRVRPPASSPGNTPGSSTT